MRIDITKEEWRRLLALADSDVVPTEASLFASVLVKILTAAEAEADYQAERREAGE